MLNKNSYSENLHNMPITEFYIRGIAVLKIECVSTYDLCWMEDDEKLKSFREIFLKQKRLNFIAHSGLFSYMHLIQVSYKNLII